MEITKILPENDLSLDLENELISFLYDNLDQFRDPKDQIQQCFNYAKDESKGGYIYFLRKLKMVNMGTIL